MQFQQLPYERPDLQTVITHANQLIDEFSQSTNYATTKQAFIAFDNLLASVITMRTLSTIRHSIDVNDEFYKAENEFWDENIPQVIKVSVDFSKVVLSHPHKQLLIDEFKKPYFLMAENNLKSFSPEIMEDLVIENKLASEYDKLMATSKIPFENEIYNISQMVPFTQSTDRSTRKKANTALWGFFEENQTQFDSIYDQLVQIRHQIAQKLGFKTFTELAYVRMNRLDYNQTMVSTYRKQILKTVVPVVNKFYKKQQKRLGLDHLYYYDMPLNFSDGNAKPILNSEQILQKGREMYHELSPETAEFIDLMLDRELMDVLAKPGKQPGGYMEFLYSFKVPFIFSNFNGTSFDIDVLTHEFGHAFQGYCSKNIIPSDVLMPTYESCEIHSMSMEFLTWPYMEKFFGDKADRYRYTHLLDSLKFLPYGVLVDHFQHEVYNNPTMTANQRRATWAQLEKQYMPYLDFEDNEFLKSGTWWFKQLHIFGAPFYYIDYTLAQVCAFQFWNRNHVLHDPQTWNDYLAICNVGGTQTFLEILQTAHLQSPFEEGALDTTIAAIESYLDSVDDLTI